MIRRPPRSTPLYSSAASDVYKRQEMGDPVPLGGFGARSRGEPNSHGNGPHMRHLLRHNHYAIREFRPLDIAWWLIHASIVAYVRLRTRLDGGCVSVQRVTHNMWGKGNMRSGPNPPAILIVLEASAAFARRGPNLRAGIRFPRSAVRAGRSEVPPRSFHSQSSPGLPPCRLFLHWSSSSSGEAAVP